VGSVAFGLRRRCGEEVIEGLDQKDSCADFGRICGLGKTIDDVMMTMFRF
jgi:hypothetical protein